MTTSSAKSPDGGVGLRGTVQGSLMGASLLLFSACGGSSDAVPGASATPTALPDTLRGTIQVVGAEPVSYPVLRLRGEGTSVRLVGPGADQARRHQGLDVKVTGQEATDGFEVTRLEVRSADGVAALEGVLVRAGSRWVLERDDGAHVPLINVPPGLQELEGRRVWVAAPVEVSAGAFGEMGGGDL